MNKRLIKDLISEVILQVGNYDADIGALERNIDLLDVAKKISKRKKTGSDQLEDIIALNSHIYQTVGSRSAWEEMGERVLQTWDFTVPTQGGPDGDGVLTFWDVSKEGVLYSVKTSLSKGPTKQGNFRFATQSSNLKFASLVGAIKENGKATKLGNIGCIYTQIGPARNIQWGEVTSPITAGRLKKNIEDLILSVNKPESEAIHQAFLELSSATGKKMSGKETATLKIIESHLSDYLSSGGRITGELPAFLGPYTETLIASITAYDPEYFWDTLGLSKRDPGVLPAEDERNKLVGRIKTISYGLSKGELMSLLQYARDLASTPD